MRNPIYRQAKHKSYRTQAPTDLKKNSHKSDNSILESKSNAPERITVQEVLGDALECLQQKGVAVACEYLENWGRLKERIPISLTQRLTILATLVQQKDPSSALQLVKTAVELSAENMSGWILMASLQDRLGHTAACVQALFRVVRSSASTPEQVLKAAHMLVRFGHQQEALDSAKAAFNHLGQPLNMASVLMYIAKMTADWACVDELKHLMSTAYSKGMGSQLKESPRTHLLWCADEKTNLKVIQDWAMRSLHLPVAASKPHPMPLEGRRIRIGYLSSDFRDHPTSQLILGLLKNHDRSKFELYMYCSSWDDKSNMRKEIEMQFEHIYSVSHLSNETAANLMKSHHIDILMELNGPTRAHRMGILAHRPAPVQISYLGWPSSVGGTVVDYIIADDYTIPSESEKNYPEKIIKISKTYQINDFLNTKLPPKARRLEVGLPENDHMVLGMFNAINKVDATVWSAWLQIMRSVPNSMLWLLDPGPVAQKYIRKTTAEHGIDPERIVIAKRLKHDEHLARLQCCDLILDPWPYGGHTSTSDALFAGVPVLALQGSNFASRVSGGLLIAAGLGVMVQSDIASYVSFATDLLNKPHILNKIKNYLKTEVSKTDLFNAESKARQIEKAWIDVISFFPNYSSLDASKYSTHGNAIPSPFSTKQVYDDFLRDTKF